MNATSAVAARPPASPGIEPLRREGTASVIAERLRTAITSGTLAPGSQLREVQLATTLGVSRGPVREALQRLIQEGLVRSEPNRGAFVSPLSVGDIADLYRARNAIELAAATMLAEDGATDSSLERVEGTLRRLADAAERRRWREAAELDLAFHEALVDATGSERLRRMFSTLVHETRRLLMLVDQRHEPRALVREHERILAAVRAGDPGRVAEAISAHMRGAMERLDTGASREPEPARPRRSTSSPRKRPEAQASTAR